MEMMKRTLLVALIVFAFGLIGTGLSMFYTRSESVPMSYTGNTRLDRVSYGFPISWCGFQKQIDTFEGITMIWNTWNSPEFFLADAVFWIALSFFICTAAMKLVNMTQRRRASKNLSVINI
jgi:hypothetical protein